MPVVVGVHGIRQQVEGEDTIHAVWLPALNSGLRRAGAPTLAADDLECAFWGDLFRKPGTKAFREAAYDHRDVDPGFELELLEALWASASATEPGIRSGGARVKGRAPLAAQRALNALLSSRYFSPLTERMLIADLKQVRAYMCDEPMRQAMQDRVVAAVRDDTRVLVGHSLGSVISYEILTAGRCPRITALVTLGSPLGIRRLIFDRLSPRPVHGIGAWPGGIRTWINVADRGDLVALEKSLASLFDGDVDDRLVDNAAKAHDAKPYLTARETGSAIALELA